MKKHLHFNWTFIVSASLVVVGSLPFGRVLAVDTQIITDGSLTINTPLDVNAPPSGSTYTITRENGQQISIPNGENRDKSIFFSFSQFNIGSGDTAHFDLDNWFRNIVVRVTGGDLTTIDGTLDVDAFVGATDRANTFLINPAGITFGANSVVDVPGSFYASTASAIHFADGKTYNVSTAQPPGLSAADPVSFGFLGNETGALNLNNSTINVYADGNLALVGGDININASHLGMQDLSGLAPPISQYFVDGIQLLMLATNGAGTVDWNNPDNTSKTTAPLNGNITITNTTIVNAGGDAEEIQLLRGGDILFDNAHIVSTNYGDDCGGFCSDSFPSAYPTSGIDIIATGQLTLDHGSSIESETSFKPVGDVNIKAHSLLIDNGSFISTSSIDVADINPDYLPDGITLVPLPVDPEAGNINIEVATDFVAKGGSQVLSSTKTFGNAGEINITAGSISLDNATINSDSKSSVNGLTGYASDAEGNIISGIDPNPFPFQNAHPVPDTEDNPYSATGQNPNPDDLTPDPYSHYYPDPNTLKDGYTTPAHTFNWNGLYSAGNQLQTVIKNAGNAGRITLTATSGDINLTNGSKVSTDIHSGVPASATGAISLTADLGSINMDGSTISSTTSGEANAGAVSLKALNGSLSMSNGAIITTDTKGINDGKSGNAGEIAITSKALNINSGSLISSSTDGLGSAGAVNVTADNVSIQGLAPIPVSNLGRYLEQGFTGIRSIASATSGGQTGTINVDVSGDVILTNGAQISISNEGNAANPGTLEQTAININANSLYLTNSQIVADSSDNVDAGNINITFKEWLKLDPSAISTIAFNGNGGNINIFGGDFMWLQDSAITTSVLGLLGGNGGNIDIRSNFLIMDSGFIQANTEATNASGGLVNINVGTLLPIGSTLIVGGNTRFDFQPFSGINVIQAVAPNGVNGQISSTAPQLNLSGTLATLIVQAFDPNAISRNLCAIGESSSLAQSGKGGLRRRAKDALITTNPAMSF
jgi:filamentous hemagglutinin family protein